MTRFDVDLAELAAVIGDLEGFQHALDRCLIDLEEAVADLHVHWSGEGAAAHRHAHDTWTAAAADMHRALDDLHAAAGIAHGNYHGAAEANREMLAQTR